MFGSKERFVEHESSPLLDKSCLKVTYCPDEENRVLEIKQQPNMATFKFYFKVLSTKMKCVMKSRNCFQFAIENFLCILRTSNE